MIGTTQFYIILAIALLLFGSSIVTKTIKSVYKAKREITTIIEEENAKDKKIIDNN